MNIVANVSLYAIVRVDGKYFGGFDPVLGRAKIVDEVLEAKLFTNKFDINLRPDEEMVEVIVTLSAANVQVTSPFKPRRKSDRFIDGAKPLAGGRRLTD